MKDWKLCKNNNDDEKCELENDYKLILDYNNPKKILENITRKGFAYPDKDSDGIIFTEDGLRLGEVIYIIDKKPKVKMIYKIYSWLVDSGGAWILFIFVVLTIIMSFINSLISLILNTF